MTTTSLMTRGPHPAPHSQQEPSVMTAESDLLLKGAIKEKKVQLWRIMKGKPMTVLDYRTRDGLADIGFSIEFQPDTGWRVYIIFDSFYRGRDNDLDLPHQSIDPAGRRYVNWPPKIGSLGEAKIVAGIWAELAQRAQAQRALYTKLIQRHLSTEKQKGVAPANPGGLDTAVNTDTAAPGRRYRAPVIPHARGPGQVLSSPQQRPSSVA